MPSTQFIAGACAGAAAVYAASKLLAWRRRALSEKPTFYYYPARGRGEQIRLTLAEAGVEFEGKYFDMSDPSSKDPYLADCREKGGNLTTNIPMCHIDGVYRTQSLAVLRYVARKFGLYPEGDIELSYIIDNLIEAANDLRSCNYKPMKMMGGGEKEKKVYLDEALPKHLKNLARLLGSRDYFAGQFTVADITLYDALDVSNRQVPGILATEYPTLAAFHARVEARPNIAKWIASEDRAKIFAFPAL